MENKLNFTAIDFETANAERSSISAVGIIRVEGGEIRQKFYSLVKPIPFKFDDFNINFTGITPEMCADKRTFAELYPEISHFFCGNIVSHYAPFDKGCLTSILNESNIPLPNLNFYCSWRISRFLLPELKSHRLNIVADFFGIKFEHHNALEDARACAEIILKLAKMNSVYSLEDFDLVGKYIFSEKMAKRIPSKCRMRNYDAPQGNSILELGFDNIAEIFDDVGEIEISKNTFVLTGLFEHMERKVLRTKIVEAGGIISDCIRDTTDYLIIGNNPTPTWKTAKYGSKIESALGKRLKGNSKLHIISENDFFESQNLISF